MLHQNKKDYGSFYIENEQTIVAEIAYRIDHEKQLLIIDHTEVDESLKGKGIGMQLLNKTVEFTRANNWKISATCSFAKSVFEIKQDYEDIYVKLNNT